jgi:hypothetical protein
VERIPSTEELELRRIPALARRTGRGRRGVPALGTALRALLAWGVLVAFVLGFAVLRSRAAVQKQVPIGTVPKVQLSSSQRAQWRAFPDYSDGIPVLLYHSVGAGRRTTVSYLDVSRKDFARQMLALKIGGFHAVSLRQFDRWYQAWRAGKSVHLPSKPVLLTFDDGRADAYKAANAILRKYGFHATALVVPGWVNSHPAFELQWSTMHEMEAGGVWTIQEHYGYGSEGVPVDARRTLGGRFGYLRYVVGHDGRHGHLESFGRFFSAFQHNMVWGQKQLRTEVPGFRPLAMAIPRSDYGQGDSNDPRIAPAVLGWLDRHYPIVFMGDYLQGGGGGTNANSRVTRQLVYRMTMTDHLSLAGLRCRLLDYAQNVPIWKEYRCNRLRT